MIALARLQQALAGLAIAGGVALIAYGLGRHHGAEGEREKVERRAQVARERVQAEVRLTDQMTLRIERIVLPEMAAHAERAAQRAEETTRAIESTPRLAAARLPADLVRVRREQAEESRRLAEAPRDRR